MSSRLDLARLLPIESRIRNPYWLAILSALFGLLFRMALDPWLGDQMPYITFLVAVALVGLFGEVSAALLSTALGAILAYLCFVQPRYRFGFRGISDAAGFFAYLTAALGIVLLTRARKKAYLRAEQRLQEQLTAESKLRDAQRVFQLFMDNRPGFSYLREQNGEYVFFNNAARRVLGATATELPGALAVLQQEDEQALKSDSPSQFIDKIELSSEERYWLTTKFTFANESRKRFVGSVSTDITDQIKAEEVAMERERLLAATQMMATVAHEVNNPLAAVVGSVHLLGQEQLSGRAREFADIAQNELSRLAHITRLALGFYKENEQLVGIDLLQLVKDVLETPRRSSQSRPEILYDPGWNGTFDLPFRQTREVLENVLGNAFESGATKIRIRIRRCGDWRNLSRSGCRISVMDDGCGMTGESRPRAFEPFFSTKTQRGKGLGLWISKAIVVKNGGTISLRSMSDAARHGTCISIFWPERISTRFVGSVSRDVDRVRGDHSSLPRIAG